MGGGVGPQSPWRENTLVDKRTPSGFAFLLDIRNHVAFIDCVSTSKGSCSSPSSSPEHHCRELGTVFDDLSWVLNRGANKQLYASYSKSSVPNVTPSVTFRSLPIVTGVRKHSGKYLCITQGNVVLLIENGRKDRCRTLTLVVPVSACLSP